MNRIKEVLEEKGIKQIWLSEQLGKSYNIMNRKSGYSSAVKISKNYHLN